MDEEIKQQVPTADESGEAQKKFVKNITIVLISNIISMLSGILIGFIIPKIMGVTEYGYYKTFTLYSSYIGILHFGFIDGIYLKFAGKKYEDLDKSKFRTYTRFLFIMEFFASLVALGVAFFFIGTNYFLIILFVSLNIFATNVITYFEFISQITMRFKRTTARNIIRCTLNILSVTALYLLWKFNDTVIYNYVYVVITLSITYILAVWYVITYRDIVFGKCGKFSDEKRELKYFFKVGVPLLLANLIGQILFVVDQQFVNLAFDNDTYAVYAFAYNMINLITVATSAISVVLYPTLKTLNADSITRNYSKINSYLLIFVALCLAVYYPLVLIVTQYLPKYVEALPIFLIILPGVLISSSIAVVKYNCYKTFNKINNYFVKSLIILCIAILADLAVYFIFGTTQSISIVSIGVLFIWYIVVEAYFIRAYKVSWIRNLLYIVLILGGFYGISFIPSIYGAFGAYIGYYAIVTLALYFNEIKGILTKLKNRKAKRAVEKSDTAQDETERQENDQDCTPQGEQTK